MNASGVEPVLLPPRSPNLHAHCERKPLRKWSCSGNALCIMHSSSTLPIIIMMIMGKVLLECIIQSAFPEHDHLRKGFLSQCACRFGLRGGKRTGSTPLAFMSASNACVYLVSALIGFRCLMLPHCPRSTTHF